LPFHQEWGASMADKIVEKALVALSDTVSVFQAMMEDKELLAELAAVVQACVKAIEAGNKILFAGNGGSAADSQHLAAEFVCRFSYDRLALPAIALTTDSSVITAISNDYGFEFLFSRQVEALGNPGDVLIGISTSGGSENIRNALKVAHDNGLVVVGMTGSNGRGMSAETDYCLVVPSMVTANIQEAHIALGHILCGLVEDMVAPKPVSAQ